MTNAENSSANPSPEAVFDALDNSPLMPLTLGILSVAEHSLTPSEIQQFIIEAAGQTDNENDDSEPTHDTSEILATCQTLQQEGLVAISQEQADREPCIELTALGGQIGVHAAYRLMERYIAQGHGDCHVPRNLDRQKLGIIGMIALGTIGLTAKVAEALAETLQIDAHIYKIVTDAIRNRPLRLQGPPAPPVAGPLLSSVKPFPVTSRSNPVLPKSSVQQILPASTRPAKTKEFTTRIVNKYLLLARHGLLLQSELLPTEVAMSSMQDRPKVPPHKIPALPAGHRPPPTATDQAMRTPARSGSPALDTTPSDPKEQAGSGGAQPASQTEPDKPNNNSHGAPGNPGRMPAKKPYGPPDRPRSQRSDTQTITGGGSSGHSGGTGGGGSSIEEVKADLAEIMDKAEGIIARLCTAESQAEAAAVLLAEARRLASEALLPGALNPLELSPHCLSTLREIAATGLDVCVAHFTCVATEAARYAGSDNPQGNLRDAVQNIRQDM